MVMGAHGIFASKLVPLEPFAGIVHVRILEIATVASIANYL